VQALPLVVAGVVAALIAPALLRTLQEGGQVRENYRGALLPVPFGVLILAAATIALAPLAVLAQFVDGDALDVAAPAVIFGVGVLGLADDVLSGASRGWRGHAAAVRGGDFSTGALKAAGTLGLALLFAYSLTRGDDGLRFALIALVVVLATNLFNLLDLRPGRSVKAFLLLGAALCLGEWSVELLERLGLYVAPILVAGAYDLRERAMLGDAGSNVIGAVAGVWLVLALGTTGLAVAAAVLVTITAYGEYRSINALVERTPGFRHLDSIGRPHRA
jgi:UDP-GlcNAc:undecaprenyl-phosphate/decaprenyl-phosphate GlcNAc-1-phosphate transferase